MVNNSFQLLRTNPALTTNVKLVVSSDYKLYLESFDTNKQLSDQKFKHFSINMNHLYEDQIINFYDGLSSELAFDVKYDGDNVDVYSTYDKQFDDIYWGGAKSVEDNWYAEDYEYLAPLFIRKGRLPEGFMVLRVDGPTSYDVDDNLYGASELNKDNFSSQIVDKWKCVNFFDMRYQSDFGYFLYNNYVNNTRYPEKSFELDFRQYEYSKFYGIDYLNGVYVTKSKFLQNLLYYEQPHFRLEKEILNTYRNNNLVFPHILNLKFLFNDVPSTPSEINNYSINSYYGFYIDKLEYVTSLTSYVSPQINSGLTLNNNLFGYYSGSTFIEIHQSPFVEGWKSDKTYWIKYEDNFYQVKKIFKDNQYYYQVISDLNLSGITLESSNNKTCFINYEEGSNNLCRTFQNPSGYTNYISGFTSDFSIDPYYEDEDKVMFGDLYVINIDGIYHILKYRNGNYYIQSDYAINSYSTYLEYWKGGYNSKYYKKKTLYNYGTKPLMYNVYRIKFSDIKDFDFSRVNTHFSDFNYEEDVYKVTDEHKLYAVDYSDNSVIDKKFMTHPRGEEGQFEVMNVSSEYVADDELYEISYNDLTDIWRKNPSVVKWGYAGSNSNCDYPYKLNNSIDIGDVFNRSCNVLDTTPYEIEKNLDYFYRIGNFISGDTSIIRYLNQTTNIEVDLYESYSKKFNLELYLNSDVDYFDYFFKNKSYFNINNLNYIKNNIKYSTFQSGEKYVPSSTLFKGLNVNILSINDISRNSGGTILNVLTNNSKNFNNYKFSIILNDVYEYYDASGYTSTVENGLSGNTIIDKNVNGVHVFLNEKYQNVLIVINIKIPMQEEYINLNNVPVFGERYGLYYSKTLGGQSLVYPISGVTEYDPALITASNFINCFEDMNSLAGFESGVTYYYINYSGQTGSTGPINIFNTGNTMKNVPNWGKYCPPFILTISEPELLETKKQSYDKQAISGPATNIYDKYLTFYDKNKKQKYNIVEPLAREMNLDIEENNLNTVYASNEVYEPNRIYRYNGSYEPIFSNINIFNNTYLYFSGSTIKQFDSNYKFDTTYQDFGRVEELIFSKVNPDDSPLKLKNTDTDKSIYPMVDEFGYQFRSRFIFNSSWDNGFYVLTNNEQDMNKQSFSNLVNYDYIINPIKPIIE